MNRKNLKKNGQKIENRKSINLQLQNLEFDKSMNHDHASIIEENEDFL